MNRPLKHITLLGLEDMMASSVTLPMEMLQAATEYSLAKHRARPDVQFQLAAQDNTPLQVRGTIRLVPDIAIPDIARTDIVMVPALWRNPLPRLAKLTGVIQWIRKQYDAGATICCAGTGLCLPAESGILDDQPATTHWYYLKKLQARYPRIQFKPGHLLTAGHRTYCAGSVNATADLAIHLIRQLFDEATARHIEQQFSPESRRPFDTSCYIQDEANNHDDEPVMIAQQWLTDHLAEAYCQTSLAARAGLNERTFTRRFRQATGFSPLQYLQRQRIRRASELLQNSDLEITDISSLTGFTDSTYFSRQFRQLTGQTPSNYRRSVRGKLFHLSGPQDQIL
ncbi:GlxA family transcriptional regulator [Spongorhabdus nitratireducens]